MGQKVSLQKYETAKKTGALQFEGAGLSSVPVTIVQDKLIVGKLRVLSLARNEIVQMYK